MAHIDNQSLRIVYYCHLIKPIKEMDMTKALEGTTLVCWIGDTDLLAFGKAGIDQDTPRFFHLAKLILAKDKEGTKHDIDNDIRNLNTNTRNSSIILTLNNANSNDIPKFSNVILLTNRPSNNPRLLEGLQELYPMFIRKSCKNFNGDITVAFVPNQTNPSKGVNGWDYQEVLIATRNVLNSYFTKGINVDQTWYNVTPGTIAQSTSLILLGKELSSNSNFIQVEKSRNRVEHCQIPFDINKVILNQAAHIESQRNDRSLAIGHTPSFVSALNKARQIAQYPVTVLLTGESGTGKEVFAREIHDMSGRTGDFVAINCAMLSKETGVAELTGVFRGAYTDAKETRGGRYHDAINGTLFLDEIGDCPLDVQAELLRFLQPLDATKPSERSWHLKGKEPKHPTKEERPYLGEQKGDIRIIAATNKNLLDQTSFRQDIYYRIETIQIKMPDLETRKVETNEESGINDIRELANAFLSTNNKAFSLNKVFREDAYEALMSHKWLGNVRELQNVITRATLLSHGESITAKDINDNLNNHEDAPSQTPQDDLKSIASALARRDITEGGVSLDERMDEFRREYCRAALRATGGNKKDAYTRLSTTPKTFDKAIRTP